MNGPLVLIVDDVEDNRVILGTWLMHLGCRVEHAVDGRDAIERAYALRPDLILMDLSMPNMDGWTATRALRACEETRDARIVAISANTAGSASSAALAAGCDAFLGKPIDLDLLGDIVRRLPAFGARPPRRRPSRPRARAAE